jgi:hypothetical protein
MLSDVDKLAHGPEFELYEINIFDGRRPHPQFMVFHDIIKVTRDFFANSAFKDKIRYKAWQLFTTANKTERVYGEMAASDWWWNEMVCQSDTLCSDIVLTMSTAEIDCKGAPKRDDCTDDHFH